MRRSTESTTTTHQISAILSGGTLTLNRFGHDAKNDFMHFSGSLDFPDKPRQSKKRLDSVKSNAANFFTIKISAATDDRNFYRVSVTGGEALQMLPQRKRAWVSAEPSCSGTRASTIRNAIEAAITKTNGIDRHHPRATFTDSGFDVGITSRTARQKVFTDIIAGRRSC